MSNDISIVSTTDTAEQVQAALTGTAAADPTSAAAKVADAPPATPAADPAPAAATPPAATEPPAAAPATPPASETPEQKAEREQLEQDTAATKSRREGRKKSIQQQIDELVGRRSSVRRDVEAEEARIAELRAQRQALESGAPAPAATPPAAAPATPPATAAAATAFTKPQPKLDDKDATGESVFKDYDAWVIALQDWTTERADFNAEQRLAARLADKDRADRAHVERASADRAQQESLASFQTKLEDFKKSAPDFDDVYANAKEDVDELLADLGPHAIDAIDLYTTRDADNGPAIVLHLLKHPEEMRRIAAMPVPMQLAQLGRLDERLDAAKKSNGPSSVVPPATSRAPEPIKPLGSSPTPAVASDPDNESYTDYKARRAREEAALAGRR